ncbi:uncharacterized protein LOC143028713 [Oratosquilla oratoria]|uniref:uncharacterized protein LOC143028713 n=1 Tax=Oratosquilla oratoria TaxID=337810 RepID=UPI003F76D708
MAITQCESDFTSSKEDLSDLNALSCPNRIAPLAVSPVVAAVQDDAPSKEASCRSSPRSSQQPRTTPLEVSHRSTPRTTLLAARPSVTAAATAAATWEILPPLPRRRWAYCRLPEPLTKMAHEATTAVSFRAPAFCSQDPSMWFSILECNFKASSITASLTKFSHTTAVLPPDVLSQVSDVIAQALKSNTPYEDLKKAVLACLQNTRAVRLQELLSKEELGNERPSDLFRRMKTLLADKYDSFGKEVFKQLFYQRLPPATQRSLFTVKDTLAIDVLAILADKFMGIIPLTQSSTVSTVTAQDTKQLADLVSQLSLQVQQMQKQLDNRSRSRLYSRHRFRRRSHSRTRTSQSPVCFYHQKFGTLAKKCKAPCTYTNPLNPSNEH